MDYYLQAGTSYYRLEEEFKKYGKLIFCVDFDDTIFDFHKKTLYQMRFFIMKIGNKL